MRAIFRARGAAQSFSPGVSLRIWSVFYLDLFTWGYPQNLEFLTIPKVGGKGPLPPGRGTRTQGLVWETDWHRPY